MTKREISSLLIKILGIYGLFQAVPSLTLLIEVISSMGHLPSLGVKLVYLLSSIIGPLFWIGLCALVICKSEAIAKLIYKEDSDASQISALNFREAQVLGFCFIGILLFVQSLPNLISVAITIRSNQISTPTYTVSDSYKEQLSELISYLTQAVIGALLFFKANSLADLWNGNKKETQNMNEIQIEKNPAEQRLQELGVFQWNIWSKEIASFPWHYDEQEICYFLEGSVLVTPEGGAPVLVGKGDLVTFPEGMSCVWDVKEPVSKHYRFG